MIKINIENPKEWTVWFDLDDTLWDFSFNSHETLIEVHEKFDLKRFWKLYEDWIHDYHLVNNPLWERLADGEITESQLRFDRFFDTFRNGGMDISEAKVSASCADKYYLSHLAKRKVLVNGAKELLVELRERGFKIGVLSNGFTDVQYDKLESGGIHNLIDFVVLSGTVGVCKPDPLIYRYAEQTAGTTADRCIMIGDNCDTDIVGALNAQWPLAIWLNRKGLKAGPKLSTAISLGSTLSVVSELWEISL